MSEEAQDGLLDMRKHLEELRSLAEERGIDVSGEMLELEKRIDKSEPGEPTRYDRVQLARFAIREGLSQP